MDNKEAPVTSNFIKTIVDRDMETGKYDGRVHTRFPPEPNGYLHIGHAKSIWLNFSMARAYGGKTNLRFDDTNPTREEQEYIDAIQFDIKWLGYDWEDRLFFASDYFEQLYEYARKLIKDGLAYVDELTAEEIREYRGTLTRPGKNSPWRDRPIAESLEILDKMRNGDFPDGSKVLRAKVDMQSPNINMRDPVMYRILHAEHPRTGNDWCIYPMYDWAHGQSDSLEKITHSICTLEFEDHRPLYDWFIEKLGIYAPQQIEFARLNVDYTITSKRKLLKLVRDKYVSGWDDPRMPTLAGMRRRGYTPEAIRDFCERTGIAKANSTVDFALLEYSLREDLNRRASRVMAVLDPLKVVITNYPEGKTEMLTGENNPEDETMGSREIPFSREIFIERSDFMEEAPKKYFRLAPGKEVRLKHAYYVTCVDVIRAASGEISELHCTYDPKTRGGWSDDGRKVKGTLHWVDVSSALDAEVRMYDKLFDRPNPEDVEEGGDFTDNINPDSLIVLKNCKVEPSLKNATTGIRYQFLRKGYFCVDSEDSSADHLIFNSIVSLRDSWKKKQNKT